MTIQEKQPSRNTNDDDDDNDDNTQPDVNEMVVYLLCSAVVGVVVLHCSRRL